MGISRQLILLILLTALGAILAAGSGLWISYSTQIKSEHLIAKLIEQTNTVYKITDDISRSQQTVQKLLREQDVDALEKLIQTNNTVLKTVEKEIVSGTARGTKIENTFQAIAATNKKVVDTALSGQLALAQQLLMNELNPQFEAISEAIKEYIEKEERAISAEIEANRRIAAKTRNVTLVILGIGLLGFFAVVWYLRRRIIKNLSSVSQALNNAAAEVKLVADNISASSKILSDNNSSQAAALEETSSSMEQLSGMTVSNVADSKTGVKLGNETKGAVESGLTQIQRMLNSMGEIRRSSDDVAKIIRTIEEIAFQTNLLALNAAVEAARAGEAGAGFSVVAGEVRTLAQRSATAAKETDERIKLAVQKSESGVQICEDVNQTFMQILEKAKETDGVIGKIAEASAEQAHGIQMINTAIHQMDEAVQKSAALAEETATTTETLNQQITVFEHAMQDLKKLTYG